MTQRRIYQGEKPYFITTNCMNFEPLFCDDKFAHILSRNIFSICEEYEALLYAYCIMPDHLHMLLKQGADLNISRIMGSIKSKTAHDLYEAGLYSGKLWHPRFLSRIVNSEKEFRAKIKYVRNNPLKDGLEEKYSEFPYLYILDQE